MGGGLLLRPFGYVRLLVAALPGGPVILDPGVDTDAVAVDVGPDVIQVQVVADVTVEFTVVEIARVADCGTPNLSRGIGVAAEHGDAGRADDGRVHAEARPVVGPRHTVRFHDGMPYAILPQNGIHTWVVAALRQPESLRRLPECPPVVLHSDSDLGPHGGFIYRKQRKVSVGGGARNDLHLARLRKAFEAPHQILFIPVHESVMYLPKQPVVHASQGLKIGKRGGPRDLLFGKLNRPLQFLQIAFLE